MNVIITGASGFVGMNLLPYLKALNFQLNVLNREDLQDIVLDRLNVDAVVHLAGKAHDLKKTSSPEEYYEVNFELTKKLYNAFLKSDAKKFIFVSSVKAAADNVEEVLSEEYVPRPQTHYGKSKLMAEEYIQAQPLPEGKRYYILRPCMIHGPGNKGNLNLLYKFVKGGIPYPLAAFQNKRSFLSVDNLCFVIKEILEQEGPSGIYQVSDDQVLSTNEVVRILSDSLSKSPQLWAISPGIIKFIAKIGDKLKLPLNTERLNKMTENYVVSNKKLKNALNISLPLNTKEGLMITAKSFDS